VVRSRCCFCVLSFEDAPECMLLLRLARESLAPLIIPQVLFVFG
jgi:hypothetical protein